MLTGKGCKRTFWDDGNVLHFDLGGGHVGIYICKILFGCIFHVCVIYCM